MAVIIPSRPARPIRVDGGGRIPAGGTTGQALVKSADADYATTWATVSGGGGVTDGDKGDVTVSGSGAVWTIDAGAVSLGKLADMATDSFLGRDSAGTGAPEVLTAAQARGILNVADGATANATDASLRDRATHTGTQGAATITGLAAVATSGSAADLSAGVLPAARFDDTAHGSRAGGGLHAAATGAAAGFMAAADKAKLDAISGTNTGDQTITLTGDVTGSGTGSFAATIAGNAVTNAKLADVASGTLKGRATAGTGDPEDLTGAQATALLDVFGAAAKGLAPASGGGTANFLRADGTWASPGGGGGGSPGGGSGEVQYNNAGAFAGAADVEIEGGQLRLPAIATPTAPAADGLKLFGTKIMGPVSLGYNGPDGNFHSVQDSLGEFTFARYQPAPSSTSIVGDNSFSMTAIGTATSASVSITNLHTMMIRVDMLVAAASTTAIAGLRGNQIAWRVGRDANAPGGFFYRCIWGPATGVATATTRALCGMQNVTTAPTDVEPSTLVNGVWMGWDAADANIQVMHNDAAGAATKIDLGASFPVPTTDRSQVYELQLYSPNSTTQSVYYRVIRYNTTDRTIAAESTGTITTNLPANTVLLAPRVWMSVGGTSSVIGAAVMGIYIGREY